MPKLLDTPHRRRVIVERVDGERAFRRRLLEMGLTPGAEVAIISVAPLGDPLQIEVRCTRWSIRRAEAALITVVGS